MNNVAAPATNSKRPFWKIYQDQFTSLGDLPALLLLDELTYRCRDGRWQIDYPALERRLRCKEWCLRKLLRKLSSSGLVATGSTHYGRGCGSRAWVDVKGNIAPVRAHRSNSTLLRCDRTGVFRQPIHTENTDRQPMADSTKTQRCALQRGGRAETGRLRDGDPDLAMITRLHFRIDDQDLDKMTSWSDDDREHAHLMLQHGLNQLAIEAGLLFQLRQRLIKVYQVDPASTWSVLRSVCLRLFAPVRLDESTEVLLDQRSVLQSWRKQNKWGVSLYQLVNLRFGQRVFDRAARSVTTKMEVPQEA
jgi:hypothetical protein